MNKIAAVILTKNNEATIADLLDSLSWCDEIIVIDDESTDNTCGIAKRKHAIVVQHALDGNYSSQRMRAYEVTSCEWLLYIDSDEQVSKVLAQEIRKAIEHPGYAGYLMKRNDVFMGKQLQYGETNHIFLLRLAKRSQAKWEHAVHEKWVVSGLVGTLHHPLLHVPHPTLHEFIDDINGYALLVAREREKEGKKVHAWDIVVYPLGKFLQNYIVRQGFRDGAPGTIMAFMMSLHSFLVRGHMWLSQRKKH